MSARDDPIGDWIRHCRVEEMASEGACHECALKNGHTVSEADNCDDGSMGCPDCPWKPSKDGEKDEKTTI